ncbi:MAG: Rieske 2Fe-2S domain-containing protein, partial [Hydrogenophaga sp.]|nr:Rieske 2Fe-2S domain-containing protein [Hydrogenophaga sp.]
MKQTHPITWERGLQTRVPYAVYQRQDILEQEQKRVYEGPVWNYLCLEAEIPMPGSYRTAFVGQTPIVVARDIDGDIYAFENRCSHRGALICLEKSGTAKDFQCVYHAWTYNLQGTLKGVAFEAGLDGAGGMPPSFCKDK